MYLDRTFGLRLSLRTFAQRIGSAKVLSQKVKSSSHGLRMEQRDDLIRYYDACARYVISVKQNKSAYQELEKFRRVWYEAIRQRLAARLGAEQFAISDGLSTFSLAVLLSSALALVLGPWPWGVLEDKFQVLGLGFDGQVLVSSADHCLHWLFISR